MRIFGVYGAKGSSLLLCRHDPRTASRLDEFTPSKKDCDRVCCSRPSNILRKEKQEAPRRDDICGLPSAPDFPSWRRRFRPVVDQRNIRPAPYTSSQAKPGATKITLRLRSSVERSARKKISAARQFRIPTAFFPPSGCRAAILLILRHGRQLCMLACRGMGTASRLCSAWKLLDFLAWCLQLETLQLQLQ